MTVYRVRTFQDIYTAVLEEVKIQSGDTTTLNRIKRDINAIYNEVASHSRWPWLRGQIDIHKPAVYSTGTANVTANSQSITLSTAPATTKKGFFFAIDGHTEIYKIQAHTAAATAVTLDTPFTGSTNTAASFKIWTDALPLPVDCRETFEIVQDYSHMPLQGVGLQEFRRVKARGPKTEGRPTYYSTSDYKEDTPYESISGLPATATRSSSSLTKTIVFASDASSYISVGDRIEVSGAGSADYNGEFVVKTVSTTTITYTGLQQEQEASTADTGITVKKLSNETEVERYRELLVWPSIHTSKITLHVDYIKDIVDLENDADEPVLPVEHRMVLVYGALSRAWTKVRNPEEAQRNYALYLRTLERMEGKLTDSKDIALFTPSRAYLSAKRRSGRFSGLNPEAAFGAGGGGGASSVSGTANTVAEFDASGELQSSDITTDELDYLNDVEELTEVTLTDNTASATNVATWTAASFDSLVIDYSIQRGATPQTGTVKLSTDGSTAYISENYAGSSAGVTFTTDISSGSIRLRYTTTSTGTDATMKYKVNKWNG